MYKIKLENVSVFYGSRCALKDINLNIRYKDFIGIIGPNGGGKTTLLKLILGFIIPNEGKIYNNYEKIGYVPQYATFNLNFPISVIDVVLMGFLSNRIKLFHKYTKQELKLAKEVMNKLGILELKNRQINQLSGGQLQKVLIARALLMKPNILLLDEPTTNIDVSSKTDIYRILKKLNMEITILIVSHDIGIISSYVNSIACLNQTLYYHDENFNINQDTIEKVYGCPVDIITHGKIPHRVLRNHQEGYDDRTAKI